MSNIDRNASDDELAWLSRSEHPLLRAVAFRLLLKRPGVDHFDLIMHHLDDSAMVQVDWGEWGLRPKMVSDYLIGEARWKTESDRMKTVEQIIMKHDYLDEAYYALNRIDIHEKYYPFIKEMSLRDRPFDERENALYALARFKKKEDIPLIKDILLTHRGYLGSQSFRLMEEFPDSSYMAVFEMFYPRRFYRTICRDQNVELAEEFLQSLASYKTDSSAKLLSAILNRRPLMPCSCDTGDLKQKMIRVIWNNPCEAYATLRTQVETAAKEMERRDRDNGISWDEGKAIVLPGDSSAEPVRWW